MWAARQRRIWAELITFLNSSLHAQWVVTRQDKRLHMRHHYGHPVGYKPPTSLPMTDTAWTQRCYRKQVLKMEPTNASDIGWCHRMLSVDTQCICCEQSVWIKGNYESPNARRCRGFNVRGFYITVPPKTRNAISNMTSRWILYLVLCPAGN